MKTKLFILSVILALMVGCATGPTTATDQVLVDMGNKIFMERHDKNGRSYHMPALTTQIQYVAAEKTLYELDGVQSVYILPYQIVVKISPLFKWDFIEPEILKILKHL